jgi:hypothetical protein
MNRPCSTPAHDADTADLQANEANTRFLDADSATVLDQAVEALARSRTVYWLGDAGVTLNALASLEHHIQHRLPVAVADARDQDCTWAEIGELLGLTRAAAWNRYGRPNRKGHPTPLEPD